MPGLWTLHVEKFATIMEHHVGSASPNTAPLPIVPQQRERERQTDSQTDIAREQAMCQVLLTQEA